MEEINKCYVLVNVEIMETILDHKYENGCEASKSDSSEP
jgi:hypothetical protein